MKIRHFRAPATALMASGLAMAVNACGPSQPLQGYGSGTPQRVGHGNAELRGDTADDVIRRSTAQWHADRWHDNRRWRR
jgi:hypothetical protein